MAADTDRFARRYEACLRGYLNASSKAAAGKRARELGDGARVEGLDLRQIAAAHSAALRALLREPTARSDVDSLTRMTDDFFAECVASSFDERTRAWRALNQALENEAKRIARAVHDEAAQLLGSVDLAIADLAADLPPQRHRRVKKVKRLLRRMEIELRNVSHELRPIMLDRLGLKPALQFLAASVARRRRIPISVGGDDPGRLPPAIEIGLYRITQEALNNVVRHARASRASIELQAARGRIACTVRDDGIGFAARRGQRRQALGLLLIRERLDALNGTLDLTSAPGRGTTLRAEIPRGS